MTATARRLVEDKGKLEKAGLKMLAWRVPSTWLALVPSEVSCVATSLCYVVYEGAVWNFRFSANRESPVFTVWTRRGAIGPRTKNRTWRTLRTWRTE